MYMHECTLSLISSSSELLFSSSSEDWVGPTTVKWFKPSKKKQKQKSCDNSNTAWDAYFHSTTYMYRYGSIFENLKGKGSQLRFPEGWGGEIHAWTSPPPPPKEKIVYITYTFLAAHEYKLLLGYKNRIKRISYTIHENQFK